MAIVVPAHNEERHIGRVIESTPDLVDMLIVVDDGSIDETAEVARQVGGSRVAVLRHPENRGVGAAVVTGYRFALKQGADLVGVVGGDGQMDTEHLPGLLNPIIEDGYDFTKGNRFFSWQSWRGMPAHRALGNVVLSLLTKPASGYWHIFDAQNGYTAISADMLRRLPLSRLETGYQFENLLLVHLNALRATVADVPIPARYGEEESGIKLRRDVPAILWSLTTGFFLRTRQRYLREGPRLAGILAVSGATVFALGIGTTLWSQLISGPAWVAQTARAGLALGVGMLGAFAYMDIRSNRDLRTPTEPRGRRTLGENGWRRKTRALADRGTSLQESSRSSDIRST